MKRLCVALTVLTLSLVAAAASASTEPARGSTGIGHWTPVTMTVTFPWDGVTPETVTASTMKGCDVGDEVVTVPAEDQLIGMLWIFRGTKTFFCAEGQFTLVYRAYRIGDARSSLGTWTIVDGTGLYAGMKGMGVVQGRYTYDGSGQKAGIVDSYAGLVLPAS